MKNQKHGMIWRMMTVMLSGCLMLVAGMSAFSFRVFAAEQPASFTEQAKKHIPQHLRITLHGVEKRESYSVVTGTAIWDDDEAVSECEFNPSVQIGNAYYRPKCTAWTLIKQGENTKEMEENTPADDPYSPVYTVENGTCRKDFELMLVEDGQEIEADGEYANGVKMGSPLKFNITSLLTVDDYVGESPASNEVEITLTEDVFGKTLPAGSENGGISGGDTCQWCGKVHEGFWDGIQGFFHKIWYFFAHLFD